jgi:hypothetical protein
MKSWAFGLLAVGVLIAVAGCGKDEAQKAAVADHCDTGFACKVTVDDKQVAETYAKFKYQKIGACSDSTRRFSWLILSDRLVVAKTPEGNDIVADMAVYLNDDGSYSGFYQEKTQVRGEMGFWKTIETKNKKALAGTWATQGTQIMVSDLGLGDAVNARGWPGLEFKLAKDNKVNPILGDKQINLILTRSLVSKDGQTIDQACAEEKAAAPAGTH